ncbi:hypothetical protein EYF80_003431 [Liparis tanakae]|uniref:Uncharacterized protein n=1 Tax=Liparis tanakae TaxID=230148 RepID=A0A4Z2J824_9TELE|nr:hypothetical protein EYF80_003431 [Liparis tanakae]
MLRTSLTLTPDKQIPPWFNSLSSSRAYEQMEPEKKNSSGCTERNLRMGPIGTTANLGGDEDDGELVMTDIVLERRWYMGRGPDHGLEFLTGRSQTQWWRAAIVFISSPTRIDQNNAAGQ